MINKKVNLFRDNLKVPYLEIKEKTITGIYKYEVEAMPYVRLYTNRENRNLLFSLSIYARDILMAIHHFTNPKYEYVIISYSKICNLYGNYSKRRYEDTIRELVSYGIIDLKSKEENSFWINPIYFSSGNRLEIYPECKVKVKTIHK